MANVKPDTTPRERFLAALERRPLPGLVPHFELVFFLTMEAFGKVHPSQRRYDQWLQMTERERRLHRRDMARLYVDIAERYEQDAIRFDPQPNTLDEAMHMIDAIRDLCGDHHALLMHGDATIGIPSGGDMEALCLRMAEDAAGVQADAQRQVDGALRRAETLAAHGGLDGFTLCADYCFNTGPFLPLAWFDRFVTPHLHRLVRAQKEMGFHVIKHTDGNIMPILDRLVPEDESCRPHALHSLDPQGGVDIAEVVRRVGDKVCLCGNVHCGLMQTGTDEQVLASARHALHEGMKASGYVFCTSNCIYTGMELRRYELILDLRRREGMLPVIRR